MISTTATRHAAAPGLLTTGCEYNVPATDTPTREVDQLLVGDWKYLQDPEGVARVRRGDTATFVFIAGGKLFRAWHSEVAGFPLVTVQDNESNERKFTTLNCARSDDGRQLTLRFVNDLLIPNSIKDSAHVERLCAEHARNPELFRGSFVVIRQ